MESNFDATRLPEKDHCVSGTASVRTLPTAGRHGEVMRRWRTRSRGDLAPPRTLRASVHEQIDIEVRVSVRRSSSYLALLPSHAETSPVLIVTDTRRLVASLSGPAASTAGTPPPLLPVAFRARPSRALLDALLELTFEAAKPRSPG